MVLELRHVAAIEQGRKTQHSRPSGGASLRHSPWRTGQVLPVQATVTEKDQWSDKITERRETLCHIKITAVAEADASTYTDAEARREGFRSAEEFFDWWRGEHGHRPRFTHRGDVCHVETPVWVCLFVLDRQRFLADIPTQGNQRGVPADPRGYAHSPGAAMADEPEAVDDETLAEFARDAKQRDRDRVVGQWEQQRADLEAQLHELRALDPERTASDVRVIKRRLDAIDKKLRQQAA